MNRNLSSEQTKALEARTLMEESLEVLRIYRHDLMNQVQLLQAYAQMKKYDRLQAPIQALVKEAQRHTEWSSFPSPIISYTVLSRDIRYPMIKWHVSYEQKEAPTLEAEMLAARVLADLFDLLGESSKTLLEALPVDVWIVAFRQGYEIGWFVSGDATWQTASWQAFAEQWAAESVQFRHEQAEDGIEYFVRFHLEN